MSRRTRRQFLRLVPAGWLAAAALGRGQGPVAAKKEEKDQEKEKLLSRDREKNNRLYRHLLGVGQKHPVKPALLGWHGKAFPDPVLAGTAAGKAQIEAGRKGREAWERFTAGTGSVAGRVLNRWLRRYAGAAWLEGEAAGTCPSPPVHPIVEHIKMEIVPLLLPLLTGTTVDFINRDECRDNISCAREPNKFSLWFTGADQLHSRRFDHSGLVDLLCKVHPDEWGTLAVVPTPFFALTDRRGRFTIPHVPPGTWRLRFGHPKLKAAEQKITVTAGKACTPVFKGLKRR